MVVGRGRKIKAGDLPIACHRSSGTSTADDCQPAGAPGGASLREIEKAHIQRVLTANDWQITRSAKILGIDRSTLYNKIKRYRITRQAGR